MIGFDEDLLWDNTVGMYNITILCNGANKKIKDFFSHRPVKALVLEKQEAKIPENEIFIKAKTKFQSTFVCRDLAKECLRWCQLRKTKKEGSIYVFRIRDYGNNWVLKYGMSFLINERLSAHTRCHPLGIEILLNKTVDDPVTTERKIQKRLTDLGTFQTQREFVLCRNKDECDLFIQLVTEIAV